MEKVKTLIDLSLRVVLSAVFIYAAVSKILRPDEFYTDIRNYQIVSGISPMHHLIFFQRLKLLRLWQYFQNAFSKFPF